MPTSVAFLFFVSGAAGLMYQVAWSRSLGLVFGASHLAVTTVLAVFMAGQALGGGLLGKRADRTSRPLALYGWMELGVAVSAVAFLGVLQIYPPVYRALSRVSDHPVYLTAVRAIFTSLALLVPTTLMGGTLPVLTRFVTARQGGLGRRLSFLYAFNTFGAVAGTLAAGFWLLRTLGVTRTLLVAAAASALVGVVALVLDRRQQTGAAAAVGRQAPSARSGSLTRGHQQLALVATGVSGFCALGYEVLWTRMLTLVVGTSVYSFAIMLTAFLAGIGIGSQLYSLLPLSRPDRPVGREHVLFLAFTQVAIGVAAVTVTVLMQDLPVLSVGIQSALLGRHDTEFGLRLASSGLVAFSFMVVPALLMGLAFPAAATVWSAGREEPGLAVGEALVANTIGAILGPLVCGFVLIYAIGIERSLQVLSLLNVGIGLTVAVAAWAARRLVLAAVPALLATVIALRVALPDWGRVWDQKYFATFTNNSRALTSPERIREMLESMEVLYYREGVNETVSAVRSFGSYQAFIVNGRPEASSNPVDVAVQRTLGHLPVLLHPAPRRAFVLGTGTGMTLGSIAVHPEVEHLVLGEIESGMLGLARTFGKWNHQVLDNPKLQVVLNDGRNFLSTTEEKFDVISADPIHPWSGGAGYLYTLEYFQTVADRLDKGGIACQWLPIYELTDRDLRSVVKTFSQAFKYVLVWLTYYDNVLIGSNEPIVIDEELIQRRIDATPLVWEDLAEVSMGSAADLLEHFLMGDSGARAFASTGVVNTDDNLWLEFSAPESQGVAVWPGRNVLALTGYRENLAGYLPPARREDPAERARWERHRAVARLTDRAQAAMLLSRPWQEVDPLLAAAYAADPGHGPLGFLLAQREFARRSDPAPVAWVELPVADGPPVRLTAVRQFVERQRVLVSFVDNARRKVFAERFIDVGRERPEADVAAYASASLDQLRRSVSGGDVAAPTAAALDGALGAESSRLPGFSP